MSVALVTIFDDEQIVSGGDPETATFAILLLGICGGVVLLFRGLHRQDMTTGGRVVAGIVGIPLGLIVLFGIGMTVVKGLPKMLREWNVARLLARRPEALVGLALQPDSSVVLLRLANGREVAFDMDEEGYLPRSLSLTFLAKVRGQ